MGDRQPSSSLLSSLSCRRCRLRAVTVVVATTLISSCTIGTRSSVRFPPYHWVSSPVRSAQPSLAARGGRGRYLVAPRSVGLFLSTPDSQFSAQFPPDIVVPAAREAFFSVMITPIDPTSLGSPPPGQVYDGNAYSLEAAYEISHK